MAYRELELTLVSAQDLKNVNLITRMDVYAVVSISGDPLTRQCTEPDTYGGRNPSWNETFRFAVPPTASAAASAGASLHVLLRAERFLGDRDVGEVVVPLADILAGATGSGPQPPHVASYQVRKLHRWEPRGVLNVSYRLGPVVAPVVERALPIPEKTTVSDYICAYGCVPPQPPHPNPSPVAYVPAPPAAAPGPPAAGRVAQHVDAAAQKQSPVMAYPVGVPQQASPRTPAKPDAYGQPPPPASSPRPAAVHHAAGHEEARRAPPTPPPTNGRNNGLGHSGPTHVYLGPQTQIIFEGPGAPTTTAAAAGGPPATWTTSLARPIMSPAGKKGEGNWAYASAAESVSAISPKSRKEDRWRHDTQQSSSPVAGAPTHRPAAAASPFSSRSSSTSSPLSSAHPSPPSSSSAHSSTRFPYSSSAQPSAAASPHLPLRPPPEVTHGTSNNGFRSNSTSSRGGGAAISSPLPSSSPLVHKHSGMVP